MPAVLFVTVDVFLGHLGPFVSLSVDTLPDKETSCTCLSQYKSFYTLQ